MTADFTEIYLAVCAAMREQAAADGAEPRVLRDPAIAAVSLLDVPRDALLGIAGDEAFVQNMFLLLIDRVPQSGELTKRLERLRSGTPREVLLDEMAANHPKIVRERRTVRFR
ncbi:MAG: hypothetical protein JWO46_1652 [Nocardioidaceae bacterium]|nr:hypothetical protein [Nocardioidaceae bacterium]